MAVAGALVCRNHSWASGRSAESEPLRCTGLQVSLGHRLQRLDVECLIGDDLLQATVLIFELFNYARLSRRIPPPRARPRAAHDVNTERSRNVQCTTTRGLDGFSRELACPPPNTRAGA